MTAVDASANIVVQFPTPTPKFPLLGVARSMAVKTVIAEPPSIKIDPYTRTWSPYYTPFARSAAVFLVTDMMDGHNKAMDNYQRFWAGIGGIKYLPSFPQLSRNETTWPHAT